MKAIILTLALIATKSALAAPGGVWEGPGALFDLKGNQISSYQLVVENIARDGRVESNVTVTLPDGTVHQEQCQITETGSEQWKAECNNGKGGGRCFGDGLCMSYIAGEAGKAFATTIVIDGAQDMRLFRTELKDGQAVRFFREKLHKR